MSIDLDTFRQFFDDNPQDPPDGEYKVEIVKAELKMSKQDNIMLVFTLKVTEGPFTGHYFWKHNALVTNDSKKYLLSDLKICEYPYMSPDGIYAHHSKLAGCVLRVTKTTNEEGYPAIEFEELLAKADYGEKGFNRPKIKRQ